MSGWVYDWFDGEDGSPVQAGEQCAPKLSAFLSQPPGLALPFPGGVQGRIRVHVKEQVLLAEVLRQGSRGLVRPVLLVTGKVCAHHRLPQLPSHG